MRVDASQRARVDLHRLPGRRLPTRSLDDERRPRDRDARRAPDQGLPRRPRRRVLQRPAGLLPVDQLRAAVLPRAARHDATCASCRSRRRCSSSRATTCSTTTRRIPDHGRGMKKDLPPGPLTWEGDRFPKDANGNYRFVYSGEDAQAGRNVNAIVLEVPLALPHRRTPSGDRIVNVLGRELGAQGRQQDRDDPRRPALDRAPAGAARRRRGSTTSCSATSWSTPSASRSPTPGSASARTTASSAPTTSGWRRTSSSGWRTSAGGSGRRSPRSACATSFDHDDSPVSVHKTYAPAADGVPAREEG